MDISPLKDWVGLIGAILALVLSIYAISTKPSKENSDKLEKLEKDSSARLEDLEKDLRKEMADQSSRITGHGQRIQKMESEMAHLPDKDIVHRLELSMTRIEGVISGLGQDLGNTSALVKEIDKYMRDNKL